MTHKASQILNTHPSMTQQSPKSETDINNIMERALRGADLSPLSSNAPVYGDFTEIPTDLRVALQMVTDANHAFMSMDAFVRERFHNDPAEMVDFLNNPENREEAVKLGLVKASETLKVDEHLETLKLIEKGLKHQNKKKGSDSHETDE